MSFNTLGLSAELLRAVTDQGYTEPTPVQRQAIPVILGGRDILAGAQTGTGKTAGFTLPLLQRLNAAPRSDERRRVRALILTPTRELAAQVEESVRTYGRYLSLSSAVIWALGPPMSVCTQPGCINATVIGSSFQSSARIWPTLLTPALVVE